MYRRNFKIHKQIHLVVDIYREMIKGQSKPVFKSEFKAELREILQPISEKQNLFQSENENLRVLRSRNVLEINK